MYSPANKGFSFLWGGSHPDHVHTMYTIQHFLRAMYLRCYNNYMIEENYNYKVMFYFLSPNILLSFVFKIASWNVFFFLRNSVLCQMKA